LSPRNRVQVQWSDGILHVLTRDGHLLREQVRGPGGHHRIANTDPLPKKPASKLALLARPDTQRNSMLCDGGGS
jgi:hypothetical protein